jgi:hypothetical protein
MKILVPEEAFTLSPEEKAFLQEAIAQADRGEVVDGWKLLSELEEQLECESD